MAAGFELFFMIRFQFVYHNSLQGCNLGYLKSASYGNLKEISLQNNISLQSELFSVQNGTYF